MQTFFKLYMYGIKNFLNLEEKRFKFPLPAQRSCGKSLDPGKSGCPCQDEVSNFLSTLWPATVGRAINEQEVQGLHTAPPPRGSGQK